MESELFQEGSEILSRAECFALLFSDGSNSAVGNGLPVKLGIVISDSTAILGYVASKLLDTNTTVAQNRERPIGQRPDLRPANVQDSSARRSAGKSTKLSHLSEQQ